MIDLNRYALLTCLLESSLASDKGREFVDLKKGTGRSGGCGLHAKIVGLRKIPAARIQETSLLDLVTLVIL